MRERGVGLEVNQNKISFYGSAELKDPVFLVKAPGLLVSQPLPWDPKP